MLLPLLPRGCSELLQEYGIPLSQWNPGSEEVALNRDIALRVLEALQGANIAVLGGDVVRITQGRLRYVDAPWACEMKPEERSLEYAERSQHTAREYIQEFIALEDYEPLFVLVLSRLP